MKYLKLFQNENEYLSYKDSSDYITPNVSMIFGNRSIRYQKKIKQLAKVGDIAYWNGSSVKTVPLSSWNTSLGTPVGVVMIGEGFLPDGKARIISLTNMTYNDSEYIPWDNIGGSGADTPIFNHNALPFTDNKGSISAMPDFHGFLPSDRTDTSEWLNGTQSFVDPLTKYAYVDLFIPSPYLSDGSFNPAYAVELEGGNALSDFNGLSNTQLLVNAGSNYRAAHACWNYKDPANSNLQWYLPAMGELGFLMPRFELINNTLQGLSNMRVLSSVVDSNGDFWSSSESSYSMLPPYYLYTGYGDVNKDYNKKASLLVRSFARV